MRMHLRASMQEHRSLKQILHQKLCARCTILDMRKGGKATLQNVVFADCKWESTESVSWCA